MGDMVSSCAVSSSSEAAILCDGDSIQLQRGQRLCSVDCRVPGSRMHPRQARHQAPRSRHQPADHCWTICKSSRLAGSEEDLLARPGACLSASPAVVLQQAASCRQGDDLAPAGMLLRARLALRPKLNPFQQ